MVTGDMRASEQRGAGAQEGAGAPAGDSMPRLEPDFRGRIGRTIADSVPDWGEPIEAGTTPNVVVVILDDTGWSDLGCFGSEIETPTIDAIAERGLRYTNFHVNPLCSPTRASLLSGRNHHSVGMGFLADTDTGFPNSRGQVARDIPLLPETLREAGAGTYLVGKWHLAPTHEITPVGPHHNWPLGRGFEHFFGFLEGCTDQYLPELYEDNHQVMPGASEEHLSTRMVDRAIEYLTQHASYRPEDPFYLQLAFGAAHAPFQAPRQYIDKYVDVFSKGWDQTRADRLARQVELGLVPADTQLTERAEATSAWDELDDDQQKLYTHLQAAYAGFLEHADSELGRVMATLEELGQLDNTIVLVLADNGTSAEAGQNGAIRVTASYGGTPESVQEQLSQLDTLGGHTGGAHYPAGWSGAGNTPFRRYKQHPDLGGVRVPLVVSWPFGIHDPGGIRTQFAHAIDIAPTILEASHLAPSEGMHGKSLLATFADAAATTSRNTQLWETFGHRAIWHDGWRAVTLHESGSDYEGERWMLYDTTSDFSEARDVAELHPERVRELERLWWTEAEKYQVLPLDDRTMVELLELRTPRGLMSRSQIVLRQQSGHVPYFSAVTGSDRSMRVTAKLRGRRTGDEGVLLSSGSAQGGYTLYILDDRLVFEHLMLGERVVCAANLAAPLGDVGVGFLLQRKEGRSAELTLLHGDAVVGRAIIPRVSATLSFWGLDVGRDRGIAVSDSYPGEFPFPQTALDTVVMDFLEDEPLAELAAVLLGSE